jgi:hypothetical protein
VDLIVRGGHGDEAGQQAGAAGGQPGAGEEPSLWIVGEVGAAEEVQHPDAPAVAVGGEADRLGERASAVEDGDGGGGVQRAAELVVLVAGGQGEQRQRGSDHRFTIRVVTCSQVGLAGRRSSKAMDEFVASSVTSPR